MGLASSLRVFLMFLLPSYLTMAAITTSQLEDDLAWLRFWVIMPFLYIIDHLMDRLNSPSFYPLIRTVLVVWCLLPGRFSGSEILFKLVGSWFNCK